MENISYALELHDSEISSIESDKKSLSIIFSHAYIYKQGKGWSQQVSLLAGNAHIEADTALYPAKISDGKLTCALGVFPNLIELPLNIDGSFRLEIVTQNSDIILIVGERLSATMVGEPTFIEDLQ